MSKDTILISLHTYKLYVNFFLISNSLQSYVLDELIFVKKNFIFFADKRETLKVFFYLQNELIGLS